jgi:hypothetical protein
MHTSCTTNSQQGAICIGVCIILILEMRRIIIEKAAHKPFRVLLQNALKKAAISGIFAGIAKDSPHWVSLFIPTNVGIHVLVRLW